MQSIGSAVRQLVNEDVGLETAIALRRRSGEQIHLHATGRAVRRRREVRVVRSGKILRFGTHRVVADCRLG